LVAGPRKEWVIELIEQVQTMAIDALRVAPRPCAAGKEQYNG
jgi:hypothetical protein